MANLKYWNSGFRFAYYLLQINPFIRMLAISGSVANPQTEDHSDVDFFIIAKKHRVWECKLVIYLFILFYSKLLRMNPTRFCCNYIIDETYIFRELTINKIAAYELLHLKILYGVPIYHQILQRYSKVIAHQFPTEQQRKNPKIINQSNQQIPLNTSKPSTLIKKLFAGGVILLKPLFKRFYSFFENLRKQYLQKQRIKTEKIYSNKYVIRWNRHFHDESL